MCFETYQYLYIQKICEMSIPNFKQNEGYQISHEITAVSVHTVGRRCQNVQNEGYQVFDERTWVWLKDKQYACRQWLLLLKCVLASHENQQPAKDTARVKKRAWVQTILETRIKAPSEQKLFGQTLSSDCTVSLHHLQAFQYYLSVVQKKRPWISKVAHVFASVYASNNK